MRFDALRAWGREYLKESKLPSFKLDADLLLLHVTGKKEVALFLDGHEEVDEALCSHYKDLIKKRAAGYPYAYITGYKDFWTLTLKVDSSTLIPRPDTETLIEAALELDIHGRVLDLGCGSGAIILALKKERPAIEATGCDRIKKAIELSKSNALLNHLDVTFTQSSWFDAFDNERFDFIVSNPPYIKEGDENLDGDGVRFEPRSALTSGSDGLDDIREIIHKAPLHLNNGGYLMLEHGYDQAEAIKELFLEHGFVNTGSKKDLSGIVRVSYAQYFKE